MNTSEHPTQQPEPSEGGYGTPTPEQEMPPGVDAVTMETQEQASTNDEKLEGKDDKASTSEKPDSESAAREDKNNADTLPDGSGTNREGQGSEHGQENSDESFSAG
ncbi:hypothetical protein [Arthrobacter antibioticus]|uniref:hypothetical protein n=1 Tax=Arthrobacter sp. H35-MC1 TaxID=3046203 RepID=UPI0024BBA016|nr:hypothetical protein [Arthrobacter sp. H35-MC1]MDJ0315780.1 hypothetical protein [Arthrobacter sp. H35-MC1]